MGSSNSKESIFYDQDLPTTPKHSKCLLCNKPSVFNLECGHPCCGTCVLHQARLGIMLEDLARVKCPILGCFQPLSRECLFIVMDSSLARKYVKLLSDNAHDRTAANAQKQEEPCPKCRVLSTANTDQFYGYCNGCNYTFCTNCRVDYHGYSCRINQEETVDRIEEGLYSKLLRELYLSNDNSESEEEESVAGAVGYSGTAKLPVCQNQKNNGMKSYDLQMHNPHSGETFTCTICFTDKAIHQSTDFGCGHLTSCTECIKQYFESLIKDGNVHGLKCPVLGCTADAQPKLVRDVVDPTIFAKYDNFLLDEALVAIPEVVYCPNARCQRRITVEDMFGFCQDCDYRFCPGCNQAFHGATECGLTESERRAELQRFISRDKAEKRIELGIRRKQNRDSEKFINDSFKKCPNCKASIEKTMGCNHMTCAKCGAHFCWLCCDLITTGDKYEHFIRDGSKCRLFEVPPE